jgi:hypothetical protein
LTRVAKAFATPNVVGRWCRSWTLVAKNSNFSQKGREVRPVSDGGACDRLDAEAGAMSTGNSCGLLVLVHRGEKGVAVVTCLRRRCSPQHHRSPSRAERVNNAVLPHLVRGATAGVIGGGALPHAASMAAHGVPNMLGRGSAAAADRLMVHHLAVFACSKAEPPLHSHSAGSSPASSLAAC